MLRLKRGKTVNEETSGVKARENMKAAIDEPGNIKRGNAWEHM